MIHIPQGRKLRPAHLLGLSSIFFLASGCHSAFVQATVVNHSGKPIRLFEVDYPSASFGGQDLADGGSFHYRFKVLGDGDAKVIWTDSQEKEHTVKGPTLHEGEEGRLTVAIGADSASWDEQLHSSR